MKKEINKLKILFIVLSIIVIVFSLMGNIVASSDGAVSLIHFESFYLYIVAILGSLYLSFNGKNANGLILLSLLSYVWTYFLVDEMIKGIIEVELTIQPMFYVYLSSSVFLGIALFFNNKSDKDFNNPIVNAQDCDVVDQNNFLFTNFLSGFKEIPYNTIILLVNDTKSSSLNLVYKLAEEQTIQIPFSAINSVSCVNRVRVSKNSKKVEDHTIKSMLLSTAMFGGAPVLQVASFYGMNSLFDTMSNNYEKVNFNSYYEVIVETMVDNELKKIVFTCDIDPKQFIDKLLSKISK